MSGPLYCNRTATRDASASLLEPAATVKVVIVTTAENGVGLAKKSSVRGSIQSGREPRIGPHDVAPADNPDPDRLRLAKLLLVLSALSDRQRRYPA